MDSRNRALYTEGQKPLWRNAEGKIECPGTEICPQCSETCPIYLNTEALKCAQNGQNEKAVYLFKKALNLAPDYYEAWNNCAAVYGFVGDYRNAHECYSMARKVNSDKLNPLFGLILSSRDMGLYHESLQWCYEYLKKATEEEKDRIKNILDDVSQRYYSEKQNAVDVLVGRGFLHYVDGMLLRVQPEGYDYAKEVKAFSDTLSISEWEDDWNSNSAEIIHRKNELKPYISNNCWIKQIGINIFHDKPLDFYIIVVEVSDGGVIQSIRVIEKKLTARFDQEKNDVIAGFEIKQVDNYPDRIKNEIVSIKCSRYIPKECSFVGKKICPPSNNVIASSNGNYLVRSQWSCVISNPIITVELTADLRITSMSYNKAQRANDAWLVQLSRPYGVDYMKAGMLSVLLEIIDAYTAEGYYEFLGMNFE